MTQTVTKRDYSKSIIYKLCCKNPNITDIYIGSTINFKKRKHDHKSNCNNNSETNKKYNYYVYQYIRDNGGWSNWDMIQIIEYSCENKKQLQSKERYYIDLLKSSLNGQLPTRTREEYIKQYILDNNDKILEHKKQKVNCDICNSIVTRSNLAQHKKTLKCIKFQELII